MKKIFISFGTLIFLGVAVAGATVAYFNDTETSAGNVFVAGTIDLTVDSYGALYNDDDIPDGFGARDLTDEHFFVFDDVKPGDYGVRHISMHVSSNPAYACVLLNNKVDEDNGITDPEDEVDGLDVPPSDGTADGDLSKGLELFVWEDLNSNYVYDPNTNETPLMHNTGIDPDSFFDITYETMFDSTYGVGPLVQNETRNLGIAWCAGTQTVDPANGTITCDGSSMGDIAQSDTFEADLVLYVEQVRNNPNFKCGDVDLGAL